MKTAVLVSGVLLLGVVGVGAGYEVGLLTDAPAASGEAAPLAAVTPSEPLPRKTPEPSTVPAFTTAGLDFRRQDFSVQQAGAAPVRLSIRAPRGWQLTKAPSSPGEVKFLDPLKERGVRVESGFPPDLTTTDSRTRLADQLKASQPYENDLQILSQGDDQVIGEDGKPRAVSTLIYTYIPNKTARYVIVRWIATGGDEQATVEMSVTGLPQDAKGLGAVLTEATRTVQLKD